MEHRNGLGTDLTIHDPSAEPEPVAALKPMPAHPSLPAGVLVNTVGATRPAIGPMLGPPASSRGLRRMSRARAA